MSLKAKASRHLRDFKGEKYSFGYGALAEVGSYAAMLPGPALVIANAGKWLKPVTQRLLADLAGNGVNLCTERCVPGARPNAPYEDVLAIAEHISRHRPGCIISVGGGSTIDAVKAANVLANLGEKLESYFGMGKVSQAVGRTGKALTPTLAVQTAAGSAAHLTKYANVTDIAVGQKKLIIDPAVTPPRAVFDYSLTQSAPAELTVDGALDAFSHCLEVFCGAAADKFELIADVACTAIELVVRYAPAALTDSHNRGAREALGLASDLGGYAIMIGGTNGAHLTSFSLVDLASHGRACGIMNPYYTVLFAPAIQRQLRAVGAIFRSAGYAQVNLDKLSGRDLAVAVAEAMKAFVAALGCPTKLSDLKSFSHDHIARVLAAAKDPALASKLANMPVPMTAADVDEYMAPLLEAASSGQFELIRCMKIG